jgi:hypothetical protein
MPANLDPDLEAVSLLAMSAGLGTSILGGQSSVEQAQGVIDYHLYRLFPIPGQRDAERPGVALDSTPKRLPGGYCVPVMQTLKILNKISYKALYMLSYSY